MQIKLFKLSVSSSERSEDELNKFLMVFLPRRKQHLWRFLFVYSEYFSIFALKNKKYVGQGYFLT